MNGARGGPGMRGGGFFFDGVDDRVRIPFVPSFRPSRYTLAVRVFASEDGSGPDRIRLSWTGTSISGDQVEGSVDLQAWTPIDITGVVGTDGVRHLEIPVETSGFKFFRVRRHAP